MIPAAQPLVLRETNWFTKLGERACAWEAEGGFWKAASYALRFFALIGSFLSIIAIPFYILADREITLQSFEQDLVRRGFIANPQEMINLQGELEQRTQERDAQMQLVEQAQVDIERLTAASGEKDANIQRLTAENEELFLTAEQQTKQLDEMSAALDRILGERVDENRERREEQQDLAQLVKEMNEFKQAQRAKLAAIKTMLAQAVLMSPNKQRAAVVRMQIDLATPVKVS